jgi:hypothetical protein
MYAEMRRVFSKRIPELGTSANIYLVDGRCFVSTYE